ncbi:MAG: ester cyclase [Pseudomonadota bacterium]
MSMEANKKLVRRFYEEIVSTGVVDGVEELFASDYVEVHEGVRYPLGVEGVKAHVLGVRQTYPDLRILVGLQIAEGEWVATCIVAQGTHEGRWLDIEPTHKPVSFTGVNVDRVVGGKIVEHGGAANMLGPLLDIGAIQVVRGEV